MGSVLTSIKNAIDSVKRFSETNSRIRRNIADIRKCTKDITSIVRDLSSISHEVKTTIKECSSTLQTKLCEQICNRLTTEDIEYIHHIAFYKEFLSHIEKMQRIDRESSSGDIISYLLDETNIEIRKYKKLFRNNEGRFRLLAEMEKFLEINNHYELESFSLSEEDSTLMTSIETTKDTYDICMKDDIDCDEKLWIPMSLLDKSAEGTRNMRQKQSKKGRRSPLLQLCKWKKKNITEGNANARCIKSLTSLLRLQQQLSKMLNDHLIRATFAETPTVRAYIIKQIINGENYFQVNSDVFKPRMAKINAKLEKIIRKHDLTEINLKLKINPEINFREALEILDDAAKRVHTVKDEIIEETKNTKGLLMMDIEAFGIDVQEGGNSGTHPTEMLPFRNTLNLLKVKGSKTVENNIEAILSWTYLVENIQVGKLIRLAEIFADTTEFMNQPTQLIQHICFDGNYENLPFLLHILDKIDSYYQGKNALSTGSTETALSQLRGRRFLQTMLSNTDAEKVSKVIRTILMEKLAQMSLDEKNILDFIFEYLLNERQDLLSSVQETNTRHLISKMLTEKVKTLLIGISRLSYEDVATEKADEMCDQTTFIEIDEDLRLLIKGVVKAIQFKEENFGSASQLRAALIKELLYRALN